MTFASFFKTLFCYLLGLLLIAFAGLWWITNNDRKVDYVVRTDGLVIPQFTQQEIDFMHQHNAKKSLPFMASAVIDVDNDGIEELFLGGGYEQQDALFVFVDNQFQEITAQVGLDNKTLQDTTYGSIALDLDKNGYTDLLVARDSGIWLYSNNNGRFSGEKLNLEIDEQTVPLSVAVADINRDGLFDMYVSGYIGLDYVEGQTIFNKEYGGISAMYLNLGNNQFSNITDEAGLYYKHNTFQAVFIDVDNDYLEDLVVAHDTGQVRTWKNMGGLKFKNISNPTSDYFAYPMGIAVGDVNNDSLPDFCFSNVGSTTPDAIVRGDLRDEQVLNKKWILFENKGGFKFEDVAQQSKLADYEFSWGAVFEDFNLDGRDDLAVSENYVSFPTHILPMFRLDGRFLLQTESGEFAETSAESGVQNRRYSISPISADFNQDGYPDLVHVNLAGKPLAFLSKGGDSNYLKVKLPNTIESIGAKVRVTLDDGRNLHQTFISGEGLCSDQSHVLTFGLTNGAASSVVVQYLNGQIAEQTGSFSNQLLEF